MMIMMNIIPIIRSKNYKTKYPPSRNFLNKISKRFLFPFFLGKKPSKINFSHEKPDWINAGTNAVGPGKQDIGILIQYIFL